MRNLRVTGRSAVGLASVALVSAGLAACGASASRSSTSSVHTTSAAAGATALSQQLTTVHTGIVVTSGEVCMSKSSRVIAGNPPPGACLIEPGSGGRYECPTSVAQSFGPNAGDAATNGSCKKVAPPRVPASWRPMLQRLAAVKACLKRAGIVAEGGSLADFQSYPDTPVGTLLMPGPTRPMSISFYISDSEASQAYARVHRNIAKEGGTMIQHGALLLTWGSLPIASVHASEERCALHS
jgi:hypothetical protein